MCGEPQSEVPVSQGDILDDRPILFWDLSSDVSRKSKTIHARVVVLTQACDVAQSKSNRVLVAVAHNAQQLVELGILTAKLIREQIRNHPVYGWYFLPRGLPLEESIVDLRDLHTIPRALLEQLVREGKRVCRIATPYGEHLAQHFSTTCSRIGLPEPSTTEPD